MGIIITVEQSKARRIGTIYSVVNDSTVNVIGGITINREKVEEC